MSEPEPLPSSSSTLVAQQDALTVLLAARRDALLLLLLGAGLVLGTWDAGRAATVGALLASILLFQLFLGLARQGTQAAHAWLGGLARPSLAVGWPIGLLILAALPATLLAGRSAWLLLGSSFLSATVGLLAGGWQIWLYFWMSDRSDLR